MNTVRSWKKTIKMLPKELKVRNVLIFSDQGGELIELLNDRFNQPQIKIIESERVLPELDRIFDLVIIDKTVECFGAEISRVLKNKGALLLKVSNRVDLLTDYDQHLSRHKSWNSKFEKFALYRHFGLGKIGDPLPAGFVPRFDCWEFVQRHKPTKEFLGDFQPVKNTAIGVRWFNGLFTVEKYRTDSIPTITPFAKWRVALWNPYSNTKSLDGWRVDWTHIGTRQSGVAVLNPINYQENWNENLKRQLKKWQKQDKFVIVEGSPEEMANGIKNKRNKVLSRIIRDVFHLMVFDQAKNHRELLRIWIVKDKVSGEAIAGLAVIDIPETKTSLHFMAFNYRDVDNLGAGTALVDLWYRESIKKGLQFLDFDLVWSLGDPFKWRGYSKFKKQFGLYLIKYPNNWFKIISPAKNI